MEETVKSLTYTVVLERNEDCGYTVTVPALRGCVTQGGTIAEALARAKEAIECHVEGLALIGKRAPGDAKVVRLDPAELSEAFVSKVVAQPDVRAAKAGARAA